MTGSNSDVWKNCSTYLSALFHPLAFPSLLFLIIYSYIPALLSPWTEDGKRLIIGLIFFATYILPVLLTFLYFNFSTSTHFTFSQLLMSNGKERFRPFIIVGFIYALLGYFLNNQLKANFIIVGIVWVMSVTILVSAVISAVWKISVHAVGISGFTAFLLFFNERFAAGDLFYFILATIIVSGFLLSARLYLNEHTILQVFAGWLMGLALTLGGMLYLLP